MTRAMSALRSAATAIARVLRAIAGVPDYERYLAHMRQRHPGVSVLSAAELIATRQRDRFERPGGRCC